MNRPHPASLIAFCIALCAIPMMSVPGYAQTGVDMGCSPTVANPCTSTPAASGSTTLSPVVGEAAALLGAALGASLHKALFGDPVADAKRAALLAQEQAIIAEKARLAKIEAERRSEEIYRRVMSNLKLSGMSAPELKSGSTAQSASGLKSGNAGGPNPLGLKLGDRGYGICGLPGIYTQGERPGCPSSQTTSNAQPVSNVQTSSTGLTYKLGETSADGLNGLSNIGIRDGSKPFGIPGLPGIAINGPTPASVTSNPTNSLPLKSSEDLQHTAPATGPAEPEPKTAEDLHGEKPPATPAANQLENVEVESKQALNAKTDEELSAKAGAPFDNGAAGPAAIGAGVQQPVIPANPVSVTDSRPPLSGKGTDNQAPNPPVISQPAGSQPSRQSDSPSGPSGVPSSASPPPLPPNRKTATTSGAADNFKKSSDEEVEKKCGMPRRFATTFRGVMLINRSSIAMFQATNLAATEVLEREGAFPKPLAMKYKTGKGAPEVAPFIAYQVPMPDDGELMTCKGCRQRHHDR